MIRHFDKLVEALAAVPVSDRACNQYAPAGDGDGNAVRRDNLRLYLEELREVGPPEMLMIGEAPSHRGGRLTGIAFVSETVLLNGVGPYLGATRGYRKATTGPQLSTEASATMVWSTIRDITPLPLLWNAFPFHPFHRGQELTNRVPDSAELAAGQPFIQELLRLFPIRKVIAIGNQASASMTRLGIEHIKVRHPSMGGKNQFVKGMRNVVGSEITRAE